MSEEQLKQAKKRIFNQAVEIARLRKALEDIKRHQEMVGGSFGLHSATWTIAKKALKETKASK